MDHAGLNAVLTAALAQYPDAHITGISPNGLFVSVPPTLELIEHQPISNSRSALDLVIAEDRHFVFEAWYEVLAEGVANCDVRLLAAPEQPVRLHFIDARHSHGVYIGMVTGAAGSVSARALDIGPVKPRLISMRKSPAAQVIDVDPAVELVLGWTAEELAGRRALDLVHPDDHQRAITSWIDMLAAPPGAARRVRLRHLHKDGTAIWFEITNHSHVDDADLPHVVAEMLDITDEMAAQEALRANERMLARLTETLPVGVLQLDRDGRVVYQNSRVARATGAEVGDTLPLDTVDVDDQPAVRAAVESVLCGEDNIDIEYGYLDARAGHRRIHALLRTLTGEDDAVNGAIVCFNDITDASRLREELRHRATYDALTGCLNRASALAALQEELANPGSRGTAVMFIDLNGFKTVNDEYGHAVGDELLRLVADRLRAAVRASDVIGRFGGDEFVVVCTNVSGIDRAARIAEAVVATLNAATLEVGATEMHLQASIGVAWAAPGSAPAESLIARADAAMYEAKRTRQGRMALVLAG